MDAMADGMVQRPSRTFSGARHEAKNIALQLNIELSAGTE